MGKRLRGWKALSPSERLVLSGLFIALPVASLSLLALGYKRSRRLIEALTRYPQPREATQVELTDADRLAQLAAIAGNQGLVKATCLRQALLLYGILRRRGLRPDLKLGVRRDEDHAFAAHAWVELEGQRLAQSDVDFAAFAEPPATAP